jgi:phosphoribosylformylglycinamidine synthase
VQLDAVPQEIAGDAADPAATLLFSESNTRFVCEVPADRAADFEARLQGLPCGWIGAVTTNPRLEVQWRGQKLVAAGIADLKEAWQAPLRWA